MGSGGRKCCAVGTTDIKSRRVFACFTVIPRSRLPHTTFRFATAPEVEDAGAIPNPPRHLTQKLRAPSGIPFSGCFPRGLKRWGEKSRFTTSTSRVPHRDRPRMYHTRFRVCSKDCGHKQMRYENNQLDDMQPWMMRTSFISHAS
jgi:hypothetical protein